MNTAIIAMLSRRPCRRIRIRQHRWGSAVRRSRSGQTAHITLCASACDAAYSRQPVL